MSKIFKLKKWLTLQEAITHISSSLSETITEADIYRLALDGHLTLSINLVNGACAHLGKFIDIADVTFKLIEHDLMGEKLTEPYRIPAQHEEYIGDNRFIQLDHSEVKHIRGVWDLTLFGSEAIDLEYYYQQLTSGPEVTLVGLDGVFLEQDGVTAQLLVDFDNNEYQVGSKAYCEKIELSIDHQKASAEEIEETRHQYKKLRREYLKERKKHSHDSCFYPSGGLGEHDFSFVIRTSEITRFLKSLEDSDESTNKTKSNRSIRTPDSSLIDSLGIMAFLLSKSTNKFRISDRPNYSKIKEAVESEVQKLGLDVNNEEDKTQISNLNRDLKKAVEQIESKLKQY